MTPSDSAPSARVLVINGTMGAGKTTVASAINDILREQNVPSAFIDADALCQAWPTNSADPYHQELLFENLRAIAPNYAKREHTHVVIARVVEDHGDRERYAQAFNTADVQIIRLTAPEEVRQARLKLREPEGFWQDFARNRTRELEASLVSLDLDDAVVDNTLPPPLVGQRVLEAAGWGGLGQ